MNYKGGCLYRRPNSPFWWMKFYVNRHAQYESTKTKDHRLAQRVPRRREAAVAAGSYHPEARSIRVEDLFALIERDYRDSGQKPWVRVEQAWRLHLEPHFGKLLVDELTSDDVEDYKEKREDEEGTNGAINREFAYLSRMLSPGRQTHPPKVRNSIRIKKLSEGPPRQGFINEEKFRDLLAACRITDSRRDQQHYRVFITIGYWLGWRAGEVRGLRVKNVEREAHAVRLFRGTTKNDEGRLMILPDECWAAVERCLEGKGPDGFLITRRGGEGIKGYNKGWNSLVERAGLPGLHYHDLRRTAARNMIRVGVPERVVMDICGWRTRAMLDRYNIVDESGLANAAQRMQKTCPMVTRMVTLDKFPRF